MRKVWETQNWVITKGNKKENQNNYEGKINK